MRNMKKTIVAAVVLCSVFVTGALAGGTIISATLRPDIKVVIDGTTQQFKDANGNVVYPVSYNDTTYLPIRSIGGIMGKTVGWDESTQTISLDNGAGTAQSSKVLMDKNGLKITYAGITSDQYKTTVNLLIENNTATGEMVQVRDVSVNGFMVTPVFSCDVAAGKKANDGLDFYSSNLEKNGITKIETIEFTFHVFESDDWSTSFTSDTIRITV